MMFKILVLQHMCHLSDEQTEYQILYSTSFRNFLGLTSGDKVPDARTIWAFREQLTQRGLFKKMFDSFYKFLENNDLILKEGIIIDGSFVELPRQRNSREENKRIKENQGDELWNGEAEKNKRRHKDTDARWTKKGGKSISATKSTQR